MEVFLPRTLEEALETKSARPETVPIAGGTDLMVDLNFRRREPTSIIDVSRVPELLEWSADPTTLYVGSGVSYSRIIKELPSTPPLAEASRTIGSPQIRNRGTLGGNLGTASPAGDALPALACFDAEVVTRRAGGAERVVALRDFLTGPRSNALEHDELIVGVRWARIRGPGVFAKIGARNAMVIAIASLCVVLDENSRTTRIAVGSAAPTVIRIPAAEQLLDEALESSGAWTDPTAPVPPDGVEEAVRALTAAISPIDDARGTAEYRRHACGVLLRRAFKWVLEERSRARESGLC